MVDEYSQESCVSETQPEKYFFRNKPKDNPYSPDQYQYKLAYALHATILPVALPDLEENFGLRTISPKWFDHTNRKACGLMRIWIPIRWTGTGESCDQDLSVKSLKYDPVKEELTESCEGDKLNIQSTYYMEVISINNAGSKTPMSPAYYEKPSKDELDNLAKHGYIMLTTVKPIIKKSGDQIIKIRLWVRPDTRIPSNHSYSCKQES